MFDTSTSTTMIGFNVKNAMLFPPEVEKGMWPENYSLSDHAHLTVEFSLVEMNCTWAVFSIPCEYNILVLVLRLLYDQIGVIFFVDLRAYNDLLAFECSHGDSM